MPELRARLMEPSLATHSLPASPAAPFTISSAITIVGSVQFDGPIEVDGYVHGEIRSNSVTVSERGTVLGSIVADKVTVSGGVKGSIFANKLVLKSACDVEGEIFHRELALEDGSYFEGKSRPHDSPLELSAKTQPPLKQLA